MLTPRDRFGIAVVFAGLVMLFVWACADSGTGGSTPTPDATTDGTTGGGGDADGDADADADSDSDSDADAAGKNPEDASLDAAKPSRNDTDANGPDADAAFHATYGARPFQSSNRRPKGTNLPAAQAAGSKLAQ